EFIDGLQSEPEKFHKGNVHELRITPGYITFQDHPKTAAGDSPSETKYFQIPIATLFKADEDRLTELLRKKSIPYGHVRGPSSWPEVFIYSSFFVVVLVTFVLVLRRLGGPGAAMSFSRSRGKLFAQEDVKATFADVAGIDEAVEELKEVVEFLKTPQKYQALGGRIPRGVLL